MQTDYHVLAPGPVNLHPRVREALALPMIHHRTPEFDAILKRTLGKLQRVFHTKESAYILTSTGSGGMEALLVNVLNPGDLVLGIDSGKFGERWCEMAKTYGAQVFRMQTEWGHSIRVPEVAEFLQKHPETKIVMCQACETSTGVAHPIRELGDLIHQYPGTLFLVDGITALGAMHLPMDDWHIDGLVGGSQKAFMLPTGMSFVALSQKAWAVAEAATTPRFYFDLRKERKANQNGETFFSSNVQLIRALDVALDLVFEKGWLRHLEEVANRANFTRHFAPALGLKLYAQAPSNSVTALSTQEGCDSSKIRGTLEKDFRITIMGGQDQAKGKILRIGHMGDIQWSEMQQLFLALHETLTKAGFAPMMARAQLEMEMKAWVVHVAN